MKDADKHVDKASSDSADKAVAENAGNAGSSVENNAGSGAAAAADQNAADNAAYKAAHPKDAASDNGKEEIFTFPCDFPIKVMGKTDPAFPDTIIALVTQHDPTFDRSRVEVRPSSGGNYTGLTVTVTANSRAQLDQLYIALTGHPMVKYVL